MNLYGQTTIERLLETGQLHSCSPTPQLTADLLTAAQDALDAADRLVVDLPAPAYTLAYDAVRKTLTAFLQAQGLRSGSEAGHHAVVIEAVSAQIGHVLGGFIKRIEAMRQLRNALEYPRDGVAVVNSADAAEALEVARELHRGITTLIDSGRVPLFR